MGLARIGQVAALVESDVHPIVYFPFEALVELFFEGRFGGVIQGGRRSFLGKGYKAIIGAENRRGTDAWSLERVRVVGSYGHMKDQSVAVGALGFAIRAEGKQLSVG